MTQVECPVYMPTSKPVATSQILTVSSCEPEAMCMPSDEYATDSTLSLWPVKTCRRAPVETFHSRTVQSFEPDTSHSPSGENATDRHDLVCPSSTRTHG